MLIQTITDSQSLFFLSFKTCLKLCNLWRDDQYLGICTLGFDFVDKCIHDIHEIEPPVRTSETKVSMFLRFVFEIGKNFYCLI